MRVKAKITLGLGLLFILIMLLAILGTKSINHLSDDTSKILSNNYSTLEYSRQMLLSLNESQPNSFRNFEYFLSKQESNITEGGEEDLTKRLREDFEILKRTKDLQTIADIRKTIYEIMSLNMQAIQYKSNVAKQTAEEAALWIGISGLLCLGIAFAFLVKFPGYIANPIKALTKGIKQIALRDYSQRISFEGNDEFRDLARAFNKMAAQLEEYEHSNLAQVLFEKKRIETIINNMHDPIIGLDESKKILFANDEAMRLLEVDSVQLVGKFAQDISLSNDLMRTLTVDLMIPESINEKAKKEPLKINHDNKDYFYDLEILNISECDSNKTKDHLIGYVIILKNITPFKELDAAKTNFIATISHELKTPISSIKLSTQLLEDNRIGGINPEQRNLIDHIKEDAERLLKITGELLNLTQAESGNIQLNIQPVDPSRIIGYAIDITKFQAEQKQVVIEIDKGENLPMVQADFEKTTWVLVNLLSNAIRYSDTGSNVFIYVRVLNQTVEFSVKDSGKGIADKYKERIFDRYFQIPGSNNSGTGLGLAISKEFIEAQGGKIYVKSEEDKGAEFTFSLKI